MALRRPIVHALTLLTPWLGLSACGSPVAPATPAAATPSASPAASGSAKADEGSNPLDPAGLVPIVTSSQMFPEIDLDRGVIEEESGYKKIFVNGMRIYARDDGSMERAPEVLPYGSLRAMRLPSRLGGGFLFSTAGSGLTHFWRSASWLAPLEPLASISYSASEILAGFDRLYIRVDYSSRFVALDAKTGELMPLGPLPPAAAYGQATFVDGWRGVIDVDLRGPLATFDAGVTWRPLGIGERPSVISGVGGDPVIYVRGGYYVLRPNGALTFNDTNEVHLRPEDFPEPTPRPPGPLGKRPLRAAIEDGFPDAGRTAVVLRNGALARVSLTDGSVVKLSEEAIFEREAQCHAVRLAAVPSGNGWGFVCGEPEGATIVYGFAAPFSVREVMRFAGPRIVESSGNGALVVSGPCADPTPKQTQSDTEETREKAEPAATSGDSKLYCVRHVDGSSQALRVTGGGDAERVVALADGRVAVLVPPNQRAGQVTVLRGNAVISSVALKLPTKPARDVKSSQRGLWLHGFEERRPNVLGGWIEAGGVTMGVKVELDGAVTFGPSKIDSTGFLVSGRLALSTGSDGEPLESTDGGMTWTPFELPETGSSRGEREQRRSCGPVGCAIGGWLRVGWGKTLVKDDLSSPRTPDASYSKYRPPLGVAMGCSLFGSVTPPLPDKPGKPDEEPMSPYAYSPWHYRYVPPSMRKAPWARFRNTEPPTLKKDEIGYDNGPYSDTVQMRAYGWGKKGGDWSRLGRWLIRFDDRFDVGGGVRSSAATVSPWADETSALNGIGMGYYGSTNWSAFLEPSGKSALTLGCTGGACTMYAVTDGQPILTMRQASGVPYAMRPFPHSAVRVGETWYFLTTGGSYDTVMLMRADLGAIRPLASFPRPMASRYQSIDPPRVVRRALSTGVGLLVTMPRGPGEASGTYYVYPVNTDTGELSDPVRLARRDLEGRAPEKCVAGQDGWLLDTSLEGAVSVSLTGSYAWLEEGSVELRLRIDPESVCAESIAARIEGTVAAPDDKPGAKPAAPAKPKEMDAHLVPLAATERTTGRRWVFGCQRTSLLTPR